MSGPNVARCLKLEIDFLRVLKDFDRCRDGVQLLDTLPNRCNRLIFNKLFQNQLLPVT